MKGFWDDYPKDPAGFEGAARKGIYVTFTVDDLPGQGLKPSYGGMPASKMKRLYPLWEEDRAGFIERYPCHVVKGMLAFERDYLEDLHKAGAELALKEILNLPEPPAGYYWHSVEPQCFLISRYEYTHRLWNPKFGYFDRFLGYEDPPPYGSPSISEPASDYFLS